MGYWERDIILQGSGVECMPSGSRSHDHGTFWLVYVLRCAFPVEAAVFAAMDLFPQSFVDDILRDFHRVVVQEAGKSLTTSF